MDINDDLRRYVRRKIGRLDRFLPRRIRASVKVDVKLKAGKGKGKQERVCEVIMHLPKERFAVKESNSSIFAAVDIAEDKLKNHIQKYKGKHTDRKVYRRLMNRVRRNSSQ